MPELSRGPVRLPVPLSVPLLVACCLLAAAIIPVALAEGRTGARAQAPIVIYLVRHAEATPPPYADDPPDPALEEAGRARAAALADVLAAEPLDSVFSTEYRRTLETTAPLAAASGLQVTPYDPAALADFASRLAGTPGRHLVVGHSNTTPELVGLLGGEPGEPIDEEREFDRLYVLVLAPGGEVTTLSLRYGGAWLPH